MLLELGTLIAQPGGVRPFSLTMDFSQLEFGGSYPASDPVQVSGQVRNQAGILMLTAVLDTVLHCTCDRCGTAFERPVHQNIEAVLARELMDQRNEDEGVFLLSGDAADLDEIVTTAFVLNMDAKLLCKEDCKGLCASCGRNLNEGSCNCKPEPDPRLAVLKQLLTNQE